MSNLQRMSDAALLILYRAIVEELSPAHDAVSMIKTELDRRGLSIPVIQ